MALTVKRLSTLPPGRHPDGKYGLYFNVVGGSRTWIQRLTISGKRKNRGLGPWPVVSLREARELGFENVRRRHRGEDPFARPVKVRTIPTFSEAADTFIKLQAKGWKAGSRNERNWRSSLAHAEPIADRPVDVIETGDVAGIIGKIIESGKVPLARTVRQRIAKILDWGTASGHRSGPNPANGELDAILPARRHRVEHRASVEHGDVGAVLARVDAHAVEHPTWRGITAAFRFTVLTASRTSEVLGARFDEIDFATATWTVPASRMKAGRPHSVPLSDAAMAIVEAQRERHGGHGAGVPLSARRAARFGGAPQAGEARRDAGNRSRIPGARSKAGVSKLALTARSPNSRWRIRSWATSRRPTSPRTYSKSGGRSCRHGRSTSPNSLDTVCAYASLYGPA